MQLGSWILLNWNTYRCQQLRCLFILLVEDWADPDPTGRCRRPNCLPCELHWEMSSDKITCGVWPLWFSELKCCKIKSSNWQCLFYDVLLLCLKCRTVTKRGEKNYLAGCKKNQRAGEFEAYYEAFNTLHLYSISTHSRSQACFKRMISVDYWWFTASPQPVLNERRPRAGDSISGSCLFMVVSMLEF